MTKKSSIANTGLGIKVKNESYAKKKKKTQQGV